MFILSTQLKSRHLWQLRTLKHPPALVSNLRSSIEDVKKLLNLDQVSDERREQGTVQSVKEGFGFIRCADRDVRMFFHFSEWLDVTRPQEVGDECEFTVAPDPNQSGRLLATRIKRVPPGNKWTSAYRRSYPLCKLSIS